MDKIINDMLINLMSNFKPGWAPAQTKSMFDCQAFNWAVSVTAKMDSVTGSRNPHVIHWFEHFWLIFAVMSNGNHSMTEGKWLDLERLMFYRLVTGLLNG